jgi:hypothetical protein
VVDLSDQPPADSTKICCSKTLGEFMGLKLRPWQESVRDMVLKMAELSPKSKGEL